MSSLPSSYMRQIFFTPLVRSISFSACIYCRTYTRILQLYFYLTSWFSGLFGVINTTLGGNQCVRTLKVISQQPFWTVLDCKVAYESKGNFREIVFMSSQPIR
jgi:hypothetical protein